MSIWQGKFWKATSERVISSVAGGALATLGAGTINVVAVDWKDVASIAVGAGIVSLLKAIVTNTATGDGPGIGAVEAVKHEGRDEHGRFTQA